MVKGFVILSALFVLGAAAPQNWGQYEGGQLTSKEWAQLGNAISDIFGVDPDDTPIEQGAQEQEQEQELQQEQEQEEQQTEDQVDGDAEQPSSDGRTERMRGQRSEQTEAGRLEDSEERNREALGRAQGRLPEREVRRRQTSRGARRGGRQNDRQQLEQQLAQQKDCQGKKEQGEKPTGTHDKYHNSFPLYEFSYGVHDPQTGDKKEQWEKRVGDHVKGKYSLDQPDGKTRIVEYVADDKRGFEAVVKQVEQRGNVKWGHSDGEVAQSYSKLKKVD